MTATANCFSVATVELRLSLSSQWIRVSLPLVAAALVFIARSPASTETVSATASTPSHSAALSALRVLVRVDARAAETRVPLADLMRNVRTIWKPYADVAFADTAAPSGNGYDDEIQLVISERPGASVSGASSLGWITFLAPGRPASFATVSVATARNLMTHSSWMGRRFDQLPLKLSQQFVTRAISWSAAHEIGHYLLRTSRHSKNGLMNGHLTALDVMWNERRWVQLEPQEVEVLRLRATRASPATREPFLEAPREEP